MAMESMVNIYLKEASSKENALIVFDRAPKRLNETFSRAGTYEEANVLQQ